MRWFAIVFASFWTMSCASKPIVDLDQFRPGFDSDGLSYQWVSYEHYPGRGHYVMTPDGRIFSKGELIGRSRVLWAQIKKIVEVHSGIDVALNFEPASDSTFVVLTGFNVQVSDGLVPECLSHWTDSSLRVRVGGKTAWVDVGRCDTDYSSDRAGRMIQELFLPYVRGLERSD